MYFKYNENGYTMIIAIFTILVISVLGLSLVTFTSNGIAKNSTRENNIIAQDLADKGLEFVTADIQKAMEEEIKKSPMTKSGFNTFLEDTLKASKFACGSNESATTGIKIAGMDNSYSYVCIESVSKLTNATNQIEEKDFYKRKVTFRSTGKINGIEKVVKSDVIFGTDLVPDQLKYAVSTNDEGNLYLHGGVHIKGDVKTDGHLIISDRATWMSGSTPKWQPSVGATILKSDKSDTPKIILNERVPITKNKDDNKYMYVLNSSNPSYNTHISGTNLNSTSYTKYDPTGNNLDEFRKALFNSSNVNIVMKSIPNDKVQVEGIVLDQANKNVTKKYKSSITASNSSHELTKLSKNDTVFLSKTKTIDEKEPYIEREEVCIKYLLFWCLESEVRDVTKYATKKVEVLDEGGKLSIGGSNSNIASLNINGIYYINGDLDIDYANLKTNAMFYVNGSVKIKNSKINEENENGTFIIFAKGSIDVSNISVDSEITKPSKIKGFFYSQEDLILYGVGSNINLHGGISARRVILTGVRGNAKNDSYESIDAQKTKDSRLQIIYDDTLISQYTSFNRDRSEEFILRLNEPEVLNKY